MTVTIDKTYGDRRRAAAIASRRKEAKTVAKIRVKTTTFASADGIEPAKEFKGGKTYDMPKGLADYFLANDLGSKVGAKKPKR